MKTHAEESSNIRSFPVLAVCTGNIVRSPLAALALAELAPQLVATSAGLRALPGLPMDERSAAFARGRGVAGTQSHQSRLLTQVDVDRAHLVLVMTREQRRDVLQLAPDATARVFTLAEFNRLLDEPVPASATVVRRGRHALIESHPFRPHHPLDDWVARAAAARNVSAAEISPEGDDIVDPYRRTDEEYAVAMTQIWDAIHGIVSSLKAFEDASTR